jgi:hypothetical protein
MADPVTAKSLTDALQRAEEARPCMNPASVIWPYVDPGPAVTVSAARPAKARERDRKIVILNP